MLEITWNQMLGMANIYQSDHDLERDLKFESWINRRKYRVVTVPELEPERTQAKLDGIEVLIIK